MANVSNSEKLDALLQFDASRKPNITQGVFDEALRKINEQRAEEALEMATKVLTEAMALKAEHAKRKREFEGASQKFEKELGKVIGKLSRFVPAGNIEASTEGDDTPIESDSENGPEENTGSDG